MTQLIDQFSAYAKWRASAAESVMRLRTWLARNEVGDAQCDLRLQYLLERLQDDKLTVARARKIQRFLSQPFSVAEVFTGSPGKYVTLKDTIAGFKGIISGEYDALPEQAFYMVGGIEEAVEKAKSV